MTIHTHEDNLPPTPGGRRAGLLLGEAQGAVHGFCIGISSCDLVEYATPGVHDDQEGFYVIEGRGTAQVGDIEFPIRPGSSFIAVKGVPHRMKRDRDSGPLKVLWAHGAV